MLQVALARELTADELCQLATDRCLQRVHSRGSQIARPQVLTLLRPHNETSGEGPPHAQGRGQPDDGIMPGSG